jgi:hypothetical protein
MSVQENQTKDVENPIFFVANRPRKWIVSSPSESFDFPCADRITPQASSYSTVNEHVRPYFFAMSWKPWTSCSSLPSPRRNFGVSFRRMIVIRAMLMKNTKAPLVYIRYLHPLLLLYGHTPTRTPFLSNGSGQFHFSCAGRSQ